MLETMIVEVLPEVAQKSNTEWLVPVTMIFGLLFGGGGLTALLKVWWDKKHGVAQTEILEDDALAGRWQHLIETQTKMLLDPLKSRLTEVESKVDFLEKELALSRSKYWKAIAHIRALLIWITKHEKDLDHDDPKTAPFPPAPPSEILMDL